MQSNPKLALTMAERATLYRIRFEATIKYMWCFTYEAYHRYIVTFTRGNGDRFRYVRYFNLFYNLYVISLLARMVALVGSDKLKQIEPFKEVNVFVQMYILQVVGQDSYMLFGITLVLAFPCIVNHYNLYRIYRIFQPTFDDIDQLYSFGRSAQLNPIKVVMNFMRNDVSNVVHSISLKFRAKTSPYLLRDDRTKTIVLFHFLQIAFFLMDLFLGFSFIVIFVLSPVCTRVILKHSILSICWIAFDSFMLLFTFYFAIHNATFIMTLALFQTNFHISPMKAQNRHLKWRPNRPNISQTMFIMIYLSKTFRLFVFSLIEIKKTINDVVQTVYTFSVALNLLANATFVVAILMRTESVNQRQFICTITFFQFTNFFISSEILFRVRNALYVADMNVHRCILDVRLHSKRPFCIREQLRMNTFHELIMTKQKFNFSLGAVYKLTRKTLFSFLAGYSTFVMFLMPFSRGKHW